MMHQWDTPRAVGDPRPTVNILQATAIAGVSRRTIYNWAADNKIESFRTRRGIRIYTDSLRRGPHSKSELAWRRRNAEM